MLLTISTTHQPASDLGYVLHKHPDRFQSVKLAIGQAHIFYPTCSDEEASIALLLDVDPIDMVRGNKRKMSGSFALQQYVNDRPYVASSFMSVAIAKAFSTAMNGRCTGKPELADVVFPLQVKISVLPAAKGGENLIRALFEPLGYSVDCKRLTLDEKFPEWGESRFYEVSLTHNLRMSELLSHLYVMIPVLDNDKHYYVAESEIDKLLEKGEGWLGQHPHKEQIIKRYFLGLKGFSRKAKEQLAANEPQEEVDVSEADAAIKKPRLHQQRLELAKKQLLEAGAKTVIDLGCGEGKLLRMLKKESQFTKIVGMDISYSELLKAKERLRWEEMSDRQKERMDLFQGSLTYKDDRLSGFDGAAIIEVIEHLDENRLKAFERVVFEHARPKTIVLSTPNADYNALYEQLSAGSMRHSDHRFEWSRAEFKAWTEKIKGKYQYDYNILPVGELDEQYGAPSQMAVLTRIENDN